MQISEVKKHTNKGIKWIFVLTSLSIPIQFLISIILGRISPEALGKYALVDLFLSIILTFFLFGGETVLIRFIPDIKEQDKKNFIITYTGIVLIIYFVITGLVYIFNISTEVLFGVILPSQYIGILVLLGLIYLIYFVLIGSLKGMLDLKASAILQKIPILLYLFYFALMISIIKYENEWSMIIYGSFLVILISLIITLIHMFKLNETGFFSKGKFKITIPREFWKYSLFVHLSTISIFFYEKIDQLIILNKFDLKVLGIYYACYKIAQFIKFMPKIINDALLPAFSSFLTHDSKEDLMQYYSNSIKYNALFATLFSIVLVLLSKEVLIIYGNEFLDYSWLVVGLALIFTMGVPGQINSNLINVEGKSHYFFAISIFTIIIQFTILFFAVDKVGLISIIISKFFAVLAGQVISTIVLRKLRPELKIPKQYYFAVLMIIISSLFISYGLIVRFIVLILSLTIITLINKRILKNLISKVSSSILRKKV